MKTTGFVIKRKVSCFFGSCGTFAPLFLKPIALSETKDIERLNQLFYACLVALGTWDGQRLARFENFQVLSYFGPLLVMKIKDVLVKTILR